MKKYTRGPVISRAYPTDERGFPLPVQEVAPELLERGGPTNNHHLAHTRRNFGRFAISQAFRDLESNQIVMPVSGHTELHQRYTAIKLPAFVHMLDRIEQAQAEDEWLQRFDMQDKKYYLEPISNGLMVALHQEFNQINESAA